MTHALVRTSPKGVGEPFFGRCVKCGMLNLPAHAATMPCPADEIVSDEQAFKDIIGQALEEVA